MINEMTELLDVAIDREIVSQAFYIAGQKKTQDPGAIALMQELADEELHHYEWIKKLKETGLRSEDWSPAKIPDLKISEYLADTNLTEGAGLQEVITVAMKREQHSIEFYSGLQKAMKSQPAAQLCGKLVLAEQNHKMKLETFYERYFLKED